jgi:hypothetical protein
MIKIPKDLVAAGEVLKENQSLKSLIEYLNIIYKYEGDMPVKILNTEPFPGGGEYRNIDIELLLFKENETTPFLVL